MTDLEAPPLPIAELLDLVAPRATTIIRPDTDRTQPGGYTVLIGNAADFAAALADNTTSTYGGVWTDMFTFGLLAACIRVGWSPAKMTNLVPAGSVGYGSVTWMTQRRPAAPANMRARTTLYPGMGSGGYVADDADTAVGQWTYTPRIYMWFTTTSTTLFGAIDCQAGLMIEGGAFGSGSYAGADNLYWLFDHALFTSEGVYNPGVVAVLAPSGSYTTNRVTAAWTYTQPQGLFQSTFQVRVFNAADANAPGFDPDAFPALYDSGQRGGGASTFDIPFSLSTGSFVVFVRGAWTVTLDPAQVRIGNPSMFLWSAWARSTTFSITAPAPVIQPPTRPTNTVPALNAAGRRVLSEPHVPTFQARLYWWDGSASWPLDVVTGGVSLDARSLIRGRLSLTVTNDELVPPAAAPIDFTRPLHPFGSYLAVARGIPGQLVNLGVYRIDTVQIDRSGDAVTPVRITASDWSAYVADARFTIATTRQTWAGANVTPQLVSDVAKAIAAEAAVSVSVITTTDRVATNYLNDRTTSRLEALKSLADSVGFVVYADETGRVLFMPSPTFADEVRWAFVEGEDAVIVSQTYTLSRDQVYDMVVAANAEATLVGSAFDTNPTSPIRRSSSNTATPWIGAGSFVPCAKPYFLGSPVIVSQAAAQAAAMTTLRRVALPADRLTIASVPIPDLRPGMIVTVRRIGSELVDTFMIESLNVPLDVTSEQQLTLVGPSTYVQAAPGT